MTLASEALAIARAGIRSADPQKAVRRVLHRDRDRLYVGRDRLRTGEGGRVHLVAIGKAAGAMVDAAVAVVGRYTAGLAITPAGYPPPRSGVPVRFGEHPVPAGGSERAGTELLRYVRGIPREDAVLFLLSGGASAVAESPSPPLTGADIARTTRALLASGAPIGAMNAIRRHLSELKGGRLAVATGTSTFATIAISDVVGDPPADIGSGPTVPDPTTFADARKAVVRYRLGGRLPARVSAYLAAGARGSVRETPKPGDARFRNAPYLLAATNRTARDAASEEARRRGYSVHRVARPVVGETQPAAARFVARLAAASRQTSHRVAVIAGGETTVTLGRRPGRGGRNQEFALAAAGGLAHLGAAIVLSVGTDGIDGPTDAAGGWCDQGTSDLAERRGLDLGSALRRHDAYPALLRLGGLIRTGPTGTNVMDLHVGLARPPAQSGYGRK